MAKDKKSKATAAAAEAQNADNEDDNTTEVIIKENIVKIAHPLAGKKLTKKILKTVKKASKLKHIKRGVKEVVKGLRKGEKGLVVLAGDISPIDVLSHVPVMCEDNEIPYCYIPSKRSLGEAASTKRPTSVLMISAAKSKGTEYEDTMNACIEEVKGMPILPSAAC